MDTDDLRPLERRILSMKDEGVPLEEIGERLRKSSAFVSRVIDWTQIPRSGETSDDSSILTPLERRVLQLREEGEDHETIGERFKKRPRFIRQVEGMAYFKKALILLSASAEAARAGEDDESGRD